ncbi:50S ribosomal protein L29 [Candidatus Synechococcus calcipolaris G9]|uniref:Large ribosomal subunit protein uL29 n=1 Tax=Candidatus Synechococcus calcipolaris G9 TaxID=1497997 RepID=A0ABT6EUV8_9SYNE|nr:50S ribosomal protein L29 [Candidatus Synechococcus calcipolaris]MDG2989627.1 50S ribosomal protein L29 [Candidatus Synechococcus calcipolaris G9]
MALTKIADLRELDDQAIADQIVDLKKQLFNLRFQKATRQEVKPHQFKHLRHTLAQLLTLEQERQSSATSANEEGN